jgi:hypothetical protein
MAAEFQFHKPGQRGGKVNGRWVNDIVKATAPENRPVSVVASPSPFGYKPKTDVSEVK